MITPLVTREQEGGTEEAPEEILLWSLSLPWTSASVETDLRLLAKEKRSRPKKESRSFLLLPLYPLSYKSKDFRRIP